MARIAGKLDLHYWVAVSDRDYRNYRCEPSYCSWTLCAEGGQARIAGGYRFGRVPRPVVPSDSEMGRIFSNNMYQVPAVHPLAGGFLVTYNPLRFASKFAWSDADGSLRHLSRPTDHEVIGFSDTPWGVIAVTGFARTKSEQEGAILSFSPTEKPPRKPTILAKLPELPRAFVVEPEGSIIYFTGEKLVRVHRSGRLEPLGGTAWYAPESPHMVREPDGVLYLSVREAVVRFSPGSSGYTATVLVPPGCSALEPLEGKPRGCRCAERAKP